MRGNCKLIRIEGDFVSHAGVSEQRKDYRVFDGVTAVDDDGDEVYFNQLYVPNRFGEVINLEGVQTLHILRRRKGKKLDGLLLGVAHEDGAKRYYPGELAKAAYGFRLDRSFRGRLFSSFMGLLIAIYLVGTFGIGARMIAKNFFEPESVAIGFAAGTALALYFLLPKIRRSSFAGWKELRRYLDNEGFAASPSATNTKY